MDTIGAYLEADHARCDALLRPARDAVRAARWPQADDALAAFRHALERHLRIEEDILFPAFDEALHQVRTPTAAMRGEHLRIRGVAQRLADALRARDAEAFLCHCDTLGVLCHQHSEKEEGILYPVMERLLAPSAVRLVAAMRAFTLEPYLEEA